MLAGALFGAASPNGHRLGRVCARMAGGFYVILSRKGRTHAAGASAGEGPARGRDGRVYVGFAVGERDKPGFELRRRDVYPFAEHRVEEP